jgi:hypothetical protein
MIRVYYLYEYITFPIIYKEKNSPHTVNAYLNVQVPVI